MKLIHQYASIILLMILVMIVCLSSLPCAAAESKFHKVTPWERLNSTPGTITIISPQNGETWYTGSRHSIKWECHGNISKRVTISILHNNKFLATVVSGNESGSVFYDVPDNWTDKNVELEIRSDQYVKVLARQPINIRRSTITFTAPKGNPNWTAGSWQGITWTPVGKPGLIKLTLEGYANYRYEIADHVDSTSGFWNFTVPSPPAFSLSSGFQICAYRDGYNQIGISEPFRIIIPSIKISPPSQSFDPGVAIPIKWTYTGDIGPKVKISILSPTGISVLDTQCSVGSGGNGDYSWTPSISSISYNDQQYTISVSSVQDPQITNQTTVTVNKATIKITNLTSEQTIQPDVPIPIRWVSNFASSGCLVKVLVYPVPVGPTTLDVQVPVAQGGYDGLKFPYKPYWMRYIIRVYYEANWLISSEIQVIVWKKNP